MERNHVLGMAFGYYLSRLDERAYERLAFGTKQETHAQIARVLGVPAESIRNWRDEFDPIHDNPRKGWHKREMRMSRALIVERLERIPSEQLHELLPAVLASPRGPAAVKLLNLAGNPEDS